MTAAAARTRGPHTQATTESAVAADAAVMQTIAECYEECLVVLHGSTRAFHAGALWTRTVLRKVCKASCWAVKQVASHIFHGITVSGLAFSASPYRSVFTMMPQAKFFLLYIFNVLILNQTHHLSDIRCVVLKPIVLCFTPCYHITWLNSHQCPHIKWQFCQQLYFSKKTFD